MPLIKLKKLPKILKDIGRVGLAAAAKLDPTGVLEAVAEAVMGDKGASEEAVIEALKSDPEALIRLKEIEEQTIARAYEHDEEMERIHAGDRHSAREREIQTKDWFPKLYASVCMILTFALIFMIGLGFMAVSITEFAFFMAGHMTNHNNYYFGSSSGSSQKQGIIDRAMQRMQR